jgi:hypothetical protein
MSNSGQQIILDDRSVPPEDRNASQTQQEFSLLPAYRGKDAWLMLAACFVMEMLVWAVWALPFSFGVFQDYYSKGDIIKGNQSSITLIGTIALGILYCIWSQSVHYPCTRNHGDFLEPTVPWLSCQPPHDPPMAAASS